MAGSDRGQENCRDELYPLGAADSEQLQVFRGVHCIDWRFPFVD